MSSPSNFDHQFEQAYSSAQLVHAQIGDILIYQPIDLQSGNSSDTLLEQFELAKENLLSRSLGMGLSGYVQGRSPAVDYLGDADDSYEQSFYSSYLQLVGEVDSEEEARIGSATEDISAGYSHTTATQADFQTLFFDELLFTAQTPPNSEVHQNSVTRTPPGNGIFYRQLQDDDASTRESFSLVPHISNPPELEKGNELGLSSVKHLERAAGGVKKRRFFKCPEPACPKNYATNAGFKYHKRNGHGRNGHDCHNCKKNFLGPASLEKHLKKIGGPDEECQKEKMSHNSCSNPGPFPESTDTPDTSSIPNTGYSDKHIISDDEEFKTPEVVKLAGKPRKRHNRPPTFMEGFGSIKPRTNGGKYFTNGMIAMD